MANALQNIMLNFTAADITAATLHTCGLHTVRKTLGLAVGECRLLNSIS